MPQYGNEEEKTLTYDKIKIRLASPEKIREWSRGEVKTKKYVIKELSVTDVVWKSQNPAFVVSAWVTLSWLLRYPIFGTSREFRAAWA